MQMKAEVVELRIEDKSYEGRAYRSRTLVLLDRTPGLRLVNTVDFMLTEEQSAKLPSHENAKLVGLNVEVGVREIKGTNNGRMRFIGELVTFNGKPLGDGPAKPPVS